mmetsp:Transcript_17420/g.21440  ORF Transcript_17420/g.21440 Transcript_17420/m.21440 type:complete len:426 (-) Transcript_17420:84-1361(-)
MSNEELPDVSKFDIDTVTGITLAVLGNAMQGLGFIIQKKAHNNIIMHNKTSNDKKGYIQSKYWIFGLIVVILGSIVNAISLSFAAQSIVLPLSSTTLVCNTILTIVVLHEPYSYLDLIGILWVIIGTTTAVVFGPRQQSRDFTSQYLKDRINDPSFQYCFWTLFGIAVVLFISIKIIECRDYYQNTKRKKLLMLLYEQNNKQATSVLSVGTVLRFHEKFKKSSSFYLFTLFSYTYLASYSGATSFLFLKGFIEIISSAFIDAWETAFTYVTFGIFLILICALEYFRQKALRLYNSLYVIPIFQVGLIIYGTVLGGLFFNEFNQLSQLNLTFFFISLAITVCGVGLLAFGSINSKDIKHENTELIKTHNDDEIHMYEPSTKFSKFKSNKNRQNSFSNYSQTNKMDNVKRKTFYESIETTTAQDVRK